MRAAELPDELLSVSPRRLVIGERDIDEVYPAALLRSLQRRVKVWRQAAAMKLVFTADITKTTETSNAAHAR